MGISELNTVQKIHSSTHLKNKSNKYKVVSLFSGCGGFDLGFMGGFSFNNKKYKKLPFEIVFANDVSKDACDTYKQNLKHNIFCSDIREFDMESLPETDVVIGGFPCQDFSVAGKRLGLRSERGNLYLAMVSAVKHCQPSVFIAENVKGILSIPNALDTIQSDFANLGYQVNWKLLNAVDYGVPQNRERILIVGTKHSANLIWPEPQKKQITAKLVLRDLEEKSWDTTFGHIWSKAKRTNGQGQKPIKANKPSVTIRAEHHGNIEFHYGLDRRLSVREAARLQSFPDKFELISNMSSSYRQIGNAVPPVLAWHLANAVLNYLQ